MHWNELWTQSVRLIESIQLQSSTVQVLSALVSLHEPLTQWASIILLVASSLQDVKATKHNALNAKIAFFIAIVFIPL